MACGAEGAVALTPPSWLRVSRHYSLCSGDVLPFLDGIFAVAFTLLSTSIPERLAAGSVGIWDLLVAISSYGLAGIAVLFYWYKMRRLVRLARRLDLPQLLLCFVGLLAIVALPKMVSLAVRYGQGAGDVLHWTPAQVANVSFFSALVLIDAIVLLLAFSLLRSQVCATHAGRSLRAVIKAQRVGFAVLLVIGLMELLVIWFNSEYLVLVPLVLFGEELMVARRFA